MKHKLHAHRIEVLEAWKVNNLFQSHMCISSIVASKYFTRVIALISSVSFLRAFIVKIFCRKTRISRIIRLEFEQ